MATVSCPGCEARFKVPDTMLGKKAKCNKCGAAFQIPADAVTITEKLAAPARPPARKTQLAGGDNGEGRASPSKPSRVGPGDGAKKADTVTQISAKPKATRVAPTPVVPDDEEPPRSSKRKPPRDEDEDAPPKRRRPRDDEEDEDDRPRPRKKSKKEKSSATLIWVLGIAGAVVLFLGIGGVLLAVYLFGGSDKSTKATPKPPPAEVPIAKALPPAPAIDTKFLPNGAQLIASVRLADMRSSQAYQQVKAQLQLLEAIADPVLMSKLGLALGDVSTIVLGANVAQRTPDVTAMVQTTKPIPASEILQRLADAKPKTITIGTYVMYDCGEFGFAVVAPTTLVMGSPPAIRTVLERNAPAVLSPSLQTALNEVDLKSTVAVVMDLKDPARRQNMRTMPLSPGGGVNMNDVEIMGLEFQAAADLAFKMVMVFKDATTAAAAKTTMDQETAQVKAKAPPGTPPELVNALASMQTTVNGPRVVATMRITLGPWVANLGDLLNPAKGGPPKQPPMPPPQPKQSIEEKSPGTWAATVPANGDYLFTVTAQSDQQANVHFRPPAKKAFSAVVQDQNNAVVATGVQQPQELKVIWTPSSGQKYTVKISNPQPTAANIVVTYQVGQTVVQQPVPTPVPTPSGGTKNWQGTIAPGQRITPLSMELAAGARLDVKVHTAHSPKMGKKALPDPNVNLWILGPGGAPVAADTSPGKDCHVNYVVQQAGQYTIAVGNLGPTIAHSTVHAKY